MSSLVVIACGGKGSRVDTKDLQKSHLTVPWLGCRREVTLMYGTDGLQSRMSSEDSQ